tara:strand:- start:15 stop:581 length:567 start_codon:yes stop_codon:yes gene_type:complete
MSVSDENLSLKVEEPETPVESETPPAPKSAPIPIVNQDDKGLSHNDKIDLILNRLNSMEERFHQAKTEKKPKRKATEKQLEVLAKAREARKANNAKRKEIKQNMKVEEKKIINQKLQEEKSKPIVEEDVKPTNENVVIERTPNKPSNFNATTRNTPTTRKNNIYEFHETPEETREQRRNRLRNSLNFK